MSLIGIAVTEEEEHCCPRLRRTSTTDVVPIGAGPSTCCGWAMELHSNFTSLDHSLPSVRPVSRGSRMVAQATARVASSSVRLAATRRRPLLQSARGIILSAADRRGTTNGLGISSVKVDDNRHRGNDVQTSESGNAEIQMCRRRECKIQIRSGTDIYAAGWADTESHTLVGEGVCGTFGAVVGNRYLVWVATCVAGVPG